MLHTERIETLGPGLELGTVGAAEGEMVESHVVLAERGGRRLRLVLMQPEKGPVAEEIHGVMHLRVGVLVEDWLGIEDRFVPGHAHGQIPHRDGDVCERWKIRHDEFPSSGWVGSCSVVLYGLHRAMVRVMTRPSGHYPFGRTGHRSSNLFR